MNDLIPPTPRDWIEDVAAARAAQAAVVAVEALPPCVWVFQTRDEHDQAWVQVAAAKRRLEVALAELSLNFELAPWGQNGNCFVTRRRSACWERGTGKFRQLFVQGREVATWNSRSGHVDLVDEVEAETRFQRLRAERAERDSAYKAERDLLIQDLVATGHRQLASFGEWVYMCGQMGGVFYRPGRCEEIRVAAKAGIKAAIKAVTKEGNEHLLEAEWDQRLHGSRY